MTGKVTGKVVAKRRLPDSKPRPVGRPAAYRPEFAEEAYRRCLLGATDEDLAQYFGVNSSMLNRWKQSHKEFRESLRNGKDYADSFVAASLYRRAIGYSCQETIAHVIDGQVVLTEVVRNYPPDTTACIFWLKNRQPRQWRDKVELEADVNVNVFPPREILDAVYEEGLKRAAERANVVNGRSERLGLLIEESGAIEDAEIG